MTATETKTFNLKDHEIALEVSPDYLFMPNATTTLFSKCVQINPGDLVFDIGSGLAPLAIWAGKMPSSHVYGVEIVPEQCELARKNVQLHNLEEKITILEGSFFNPIPEGLKADVIIADVSGISEGPARALGWYPKDIPTGGHDGTGVIIPLLKQAPEYMHSSTKLYFPAASLSDYRKIMAVAENKFNLKTVIDKSFPISPEQMQAIRSSSDSKTYETYKKGPVRDIWQGWIYEAILKE